MKQISRNLLHISLVQLSTSKPRSGTGRGRGRAPLSNLQIVERTTVEWNGPGIRHFCVSPSNCLTACIPVSFPSFLDSFVDRQPRAALSHLRQKAESSSRGVACRMSEMAQKTVKIKQSLSISSRYLVIRDQISPHFTDITPANHSYQENEKKMCG